MIEAQTLSERSPALNALLVRRKHPPVRLAPTGRTTPSRALVVIPETAPSGFAADLRFFAICYLAGFIFFLIMLS
jgi:hypothetical protein